MVAVALQAATAMHLPLQHTREDIRRASASFSEICVELTWRLAYVRCDPCRGHAIEDLLRGQSDGGIAEDPRLTRP